MGIAIGVLVMILLVVVIVRNIVGYRVETTISFPSGPETSEQPEIPTPSQAELAARSAAMPSEWVEYPGATPPLKLHVRGQTYETYRLFVRKHLNGVGQEVFEAMSPAMAANFHHTVMADAYVCGWEGAAYPNGAPLAFTPQKLALMLDSDPYLEGFLLETAHRLCPPRLEERARA